MLKERKEQKKSFLICRSHLLLIAAKEFLWIGQTKTNEEG
jgi:hypothetical protein